MVDCGLSNDCSKVYAPNATAVCFWSSSTNLEVSYDWTSAAGDDFNSHSGWTFLGVVMVLIALIALVFGCYCVYWSCNPHKYSQIA
jgi:hypothetical protein